MRFRQFIGMMSGLSGDVLNYAEVARSLQVSQPTARDYFQIVHGIFLWRCLPAYDRNVRKRVVKYPKGYLRDSGLLPIQIKHGQTVDARALRTMREFIDDHGCPLGVIVSNERELRLYDEKIVGVPFNHL